MRAALAGLIAIFAVGCGHGGDEHPASHATEKPQQAEVLVYDGFGADNTGTDSLVDILNKHGVMSQTADEKAFEKMSVDDIAKFRTLIWPGGDNDEMDKVLTPALRQKIRSAVVDRGVNYVGICAGAYLAVGPSDKNFEIIKAEAQERHLPPDGPISMAWTYFPDGSRRHLLLWYGPHFSFKKGVIARYEDGQPAMVQMKVNEAFVVLIGPHPEAPADWAPDGGVVDSDGVDFDVMWKLIKAAHTRVPLPEFKDAASFTQ